MLKKLFMVTNNCNNYNKTIQIYRNDKNYLKLT